MTMEVILKVKTRPMKRKQVRDWKRTKNLKNTRLMKIPTANCQVLPQSLSDFVY